MNRKKNQAKKKEIKSFSINKKELFRPKKETEVKKEKSLNKNKKVTFLADKKNNIGKKYTKTEKNSINTKHKANKSTQKEKTNNKNNKMNNIKTKEKQSQTRNKDKLENKKLNTTKDKNNKSKDAQNKTKKVSSPKKKNLTIKVSSPISNKSKNASTEKLIAEDKLSAVLVHKSKETLSTNMETITTEKEKIDEDMQELKNTIKTIFTPIPSLIRKSSKNVSGLQPNIKDVEKAIKLRRQQYNEYLKMLNKPKPKPKPKPKVYDLNSVIFIQKVFRAYHITDVNQNITRLKINSCVTELLCLILHHVFNHARRRITFYMFKNYYHDPFTNIFTEVNFTDKLTMKLSDTYYNFNDFFK